MTPRHEPARDDRVRELEANIGPIHFHAHRAAADEPEAEVPLLRTSGRGRSERASPKNL
jgi:hypothetical protein